MFKSGAMGPKGPPNPRSEVMARAGQGRTRGTSPAGGECKGKSGNNKPLWPFPGPNWRLQGYHTADKAVEGVQGKRGFKPPLRDPQGLSGARLGQSGPSD